MSNIATKSWQPAAVWCLANSRVSEWPISFLVDEREIEVRTILNHGGNRIALFKVGTEDERVYEPVLRMGKIPDGASGHSFSWPDAPG